MRWVAALVAATGIACDTWDLRMPPPPPPEIAGPPVGSTHRSYAALPWYLVCRPETPLGPIARYDERVPVAGGRGAGPSDALRMRLAELDAESVALRGSRVPRRLTELRDTVTAIAEIVQPRPDLAGEAAELTDVVNRLEMANELEGEGLIDRLLAIADLMRLQLRAS